MGNHNRAARTLTVLGSVVLLTNAALHCYGGAQVGFPALAASNLAPDLKVAFQVVFLSLAWHWVLIATVALLAAFIDTRLQKTLVLLCGLGMLLEAGVGTAMVGFFIGTEMIGAAALLLACGGMLFRSGPSD